VNRTSPNEYHVYLDGASSIAEADVVLERKIQNGVYTLTLTTSDTNEVLHTETAPRSASKRAIVAMSKWITSRAWE
jgi:hypothetical protein